MKRCLIFLWLLLFALSAFADDKLPQSRWANFGKDRIHYYDVGNQRSSSAIVFIHGWTCSADFWKASLNAFPEHRVIALDLVGHGQSDKPNAIYSMEFFARSVDAVLTRAKVNRAVLVGHSMGTPVARQFYWLFPAKTAGIVIVDGTLRKPPDNPDFAKALEGLRTNYIQNAPRFLEGMLGPVKDAELRDWIRERMLATRAQVAMSAMDSMNDLRIWQEDKINVPVLAIMAKSPFWQEDEEGFFRSVAPDLDFKMWEGASHFLMMERSREFNSEVAAFINTKKLL
jgi:pimeloyl-ACP methyl ester carboxylesterase